MTRKIVPVKSLRTFQRYMGVPGVEVQVNSRENMHPAFGGKWDNPKADSFETPRGGWIPSSLAGARSHFGSNYKMLAIRFILPEPTNA